MCQPDLPRKVMLVTMFVAGHLYSLPLQSLPDQYALVDIDASLDVMGDTLLGKTKRARPVLGRSTKVQFLAVANAMLNLVPHQSLDAWQATHIDRNDPGTVRVFDSKLQQWYDLGTQVTHSHTLISASSKHSGLPGLVCAGVCNMCVLGTGGIRRTDPPSGCWRLSSA